MNKNSTIYTVTNQANSSSVDENLLNGLKTNSRAAFSGLYDQYAPILLGVITKIVDDRDEAVTLLEATFKKVYDQIHEVQAKQQPLFVWLLKIARCTALDILKERKNVNPFALQLTTAGRIVVSSTPDDHVVVAHVNLTDLQLNELLNKVLFENCTPEEAASSFGLPVASVRQQLRLATNQLRASQKA